MIRKDAEENLKRERPQQGDATAPPAKPTRRLDDDEEMEVDEGGEWGGDPMEDDNHPPPEVGQLLQEALEYGQELRAEFADSTGADPEMSRQLDEIFALIAYENPLRQEGVKHLLDRSGRVAVAEELNSAILRESTFTPISADGANRQASIPGKTIPLRSRDNVRTNGGASRAAPRRRRRRRLRGDPGYHGPDHEAGDPFLVGGRLASVRGAGPVPSYCRFFTHDTSSISTSPGAACTE